MLKSQRTKKELLFKNKRGRVGGEKHEARERKPVSAVIRRVRKSWKKQPKGKLAGRPARYRARRTIFLSAGEKKRQKKKRVDAGADAFRL